MRFKVISFMDYNNTSLGKPQKERDIKPRRFFCFINLCFSCFSTLCFDYFSFGLHLLFASSLLLFVPYLPSILAFYCYYLMWCVTFRFTLLLGVEHPLKMSNLRVHTPILIYIDHHHHHLIEVSG
jgi:hypothetical protein